MVKSTDIKRLSVLPISLFLLLLLNGCGTHLPSSAERFYKTELYFGTEKPDGTALSPAAWADFRDRVITPRFQAGFTVLESYGQWLHESGAVQRETSKVVVFLYDTPQPADKHIETIRRLYCEQFEQEAVMRVDERVHVSF